jgi:hypothetical protein
VQICLSSGRFQRAKVELRSNRRRSWAASQARGLYRSGILGATRSALKGPSISRSALLKPCNTTAATPEAAEELIRNGWLLKENSSMPRESPKLRLHQHIACSHLNIRTADCTHYAPYPSSAKFSTRCDRHSTGHPRRLGAEAA